MAIVEIPARIEQAVTEAVERELEAALRSRGLVLPADRLAAAESEATQIGAHLLAEVIRRCYPSGGGVDGELTVEVDGDRVAARLGAALAFGAVSAQLLGPPTPEGPGGPVELLCAIFNLGIGLVDSLCDEDAVAGGTLLELVRLQDLAGAVQEPRDRGWLRVALPPRAAVDHTVSFTIDIIETFFEMLHWVFPGDRWLRRRRDVGVQLGAALEAEHRSVAGTSAATCREQLVEWSRLTSVLPFEIIETLAGGTRSSGEAGTGTLLGEAMWRIDDLVDVCQDARSGSLNSVLLAAAEDAAEPGDGDLAATLERLTASTIVAYTAGEAAEALSAGLEAGAGPVRDHPPEVLFLSFIQRYAGLAPRRSS